MNNLVLGYGKLGSEIVKQTGWDYITRSKNNFDFRNLKTYICHIYKYDTIINCIANTNTYCENYEDIISVNYRPIIPLVEYCNKRKMKLVQISSDYVYANSSADAKETSVPVHAENWYSYSKLVADAYIQEFCENYLIIRTSFKSSPFLYEKAFDDLVGNFDYTEKIACIISNLVYENASGIFNVGTKKKTMYELAQQTNPSVIPVKGELLDTMPSDVSMDVSKMMKFYEEKIKPGLEENTGEN
jgi:dTDP-4-dehydrorhamnose reductase